MKKPRKKKSLPAEINPDAETYHPVRILHINKDDDEKAIYAKLRASFTAADLQRFTQDEEMMPAEDFLAELKALQRQATRARNKKKRTDYCQG
jgi:hypothetical protein